MLDISSAKIAGNPGEAGWVQVYDFAPDDVEKLKLRGHLFAVISVKKPGEGIENVVAGREIISRLHEEYFGKTETTSFNALKLAVEKVALEFEEALGKIEIAAIAQLDNVVYSAAFGGSQVAIFRNQMFAKILVSPVGQTVTASGYPQEGDIMFVGTQKVFETFSDLQLKESLVSLDPKISAENVAALIHSQKEESILGVLILKFSSQTPVETVIVAPQVAPPLDQAKGMFDKFSQKAKGLFEDLTKGINSKLPQKRIYIQKDRSGEFEASEKKGVTFSVGIILLVLLIVSIIFGIRQRNIKEQRSMYEERLTQAIENYGAALNLYEAEPDQARALYIESENLANILKGEGVKDNRLDKLLEDLTTQRGPILGEYTQDPSLFMDLTLLSSGFKGDSFALTGEKLYVLDKSAKKIVSIEIATKKTQVVAGPDSLENPTGFTAYEDRAFVIEEDGINEVASRATNVVSKDWSGEVLVRAYAGNLYVLDKGGSMIWRYPGAGEEFSEKQTWLGEGVSPDFSKITSMTIDGTIWFLNESAKVFRFSQGSPQSFSLPTDVSPAITTVNQIFTNEVEENLYLLDPSNNRIVVIDKTGKFIAQHTNSLLGQAQDVIADTEGNRMIILIDGKLYTLEINF